MAINTNNLWWVLVGALVIIAIFLGIQQYTPGLIKDTFESSKSTIEISDWDKDEIKYQCFLFNNFEIENNKLYADIKNICYENKSYSLTLDIYNNKDNITKSLNMIKTINGEETLIKTELGTLDGIEEIYTLKIKKAF